MVEKTFADNGVANDVATERTPVRVVVVDDHPVVASGIQQLLARSDSFDLVGSAETGSEGVDLCREIQPNLLLLDLRLDDLPAATVCRKVRAASPQTNIVVWTAFPDALALRSCLRVGATACLIKDVTEHDLLVLLARAARGKVVVDPRLASELLGLDDDGVLSAREHEVLVLMARGLSSHQIAQNLGLSTNTVKTHRHTLLAKLGARNRVEALLQADLRGLLPGRDS